jgi:WD40 repeat protein
MRLWDIASLRQLTTPETGYVLRGPPTSALWVKRRDQSRHILAFGTAFGYLVFWRRTVSSSYMALDTANLLQDQNSFEECYSRQVGRAREITCLAWDSSNEATLRLASGTQDGIVQLWSFNGKELHPVWSIELDGTCPRTLGFVDNKPDIYVFGMFNGLW